MALHSSSTIILLKLLFLASYVYAARDLGFTDDTDLYSFVSRPELKAARLNVTIYDPSAVTPGYFFVAPYAKISQDPQAERYYQACQTGPAIYDGSGELAWSGACKFRNQNSCDFRMNRFNDTDHLSLILNKWRPYDEKGRGIIMNNDFEVTHEIYPPHGIHAFNMHEFNVIEGGKSALAVVHRTEVVNTTALGLENKIEKGLVANMGLHEFDVATGKTNFIWWALDHLKLSESTVEIKDLNKGGWNFFHMNSVEKNEGGDYMVSARFTDTIYKISSDGHVIWKLGGKDSSFVLDGFNFSKQHDARFIEKTGPNKEVISFFDNASDGESNDTSTYSSALLVELDTGASPPITKVIRRWIRPDEGISDRRGNFQLLPNKNAFVGWSENSYISEHTYDGDIVMEARFASQRFVTYRAYKHNFTGHPIEPPTLKVHVWGTSPAESLSVCYVSWNGATEVAMWEFHRVDTSTDQSSLISRTKKSGFETIFQFAGYERSVYAVAISATGEVLGRSEALSTEITTTWQNENQVETANDDGPTINNEAPLDAEPKTHQEL